MNHCTAAKQNSGDCIRLVAGFFLNSESIVLFCLSYTCNQESTSRLCVVKVKGQTMYRQRGNYISHFSFFYRDKFVIKFLPYLSNELFILFH